MTNRSVKIHWHRLALAGVGLLLLAATGCGTFHRDWKSAPAKPAAAGGIEGAWEGTWLSHVNGHTGRLRAIITQTATGDYETRFRATYWALFSSEYSVKLAATPLGGEFRLRGSKDLGRLFGYNLGEFSYEGTASATEFRCTYKSQSDHGIFEMSRPGR